jgi:hypothetical protein
MMLNTSAQRIFPRASHLGHAALQQVALASLLNHHAVARKTRILQGEFVNAAADMQAALSTLNLKSLKVSYKACILASCSTAYVRIEEDTAAQPVTGIPLGHPGCDLISLMDDNSTCR